MSLKKVSKKSCNKRGQIGLDLLTIVLILFALGAVSLVAYMVSNNLNAEIQADDDFNAQSKAVVNDINTSYPKWFDNAFMFILIFFWLGMLLSSFLIDSHPVFFIIAVILIILSLLVGAAIVNAMEELFEDPDLASASQDFPKLIWIMDHWLIISIVMAFSAAIALYAKGT